MNIEYIEYIDDSDLNEFRFRIGHKFINYIQANTLENSKNIIDLFDKSKKLLAFI